MKRVVSLPESPIPFELEDLRKAFNEAYKALWAGLPIPATPEGLQMHEAVGRPQLVLLDVSIVDNSHLATDGGAVLPV